MAHILKRDSDVHPPVSTVVTASAGAGKTHALTHRYTQFLLSDRIPHTAPRSMLAITFTNNAAAEMKQRILTLLKELSLNHPAAIEEMSALLSVDPATLPQRSAQQLDALLTSYSDFQIRTIDSFMSSVFLCSSLDLGYHPGFEIVLNPDAMIDEAAAECARSIRKGTPMASIFAGLADRMMAEKKSTEKYHWNPFAAILAEVKRFYADLDVMPETVDAADLTADIALLKEAAEALASSLLRRIADTGLDINANVKKDLERFAAGDFSKVVDNAFKKDILKKGTKDGLSPAAAAIADSVRSDYEEALLPQLSILVFMLSRNYFRPYVRALHVIGEALEVVKRRTARVFLNDVSRTMASHVTAEIVPDIYFKLGDTVHHYLIDEFQDTSPVQWKNLRPLIENSLAAEGTLFVVGDTKQSIYSFRGADWKIMKALQQPEMFPSAACDPQTLGINYRSFERIVEFNRILFKEKIGTSDEFRDAAEASGLSTYIEEVKEEHRGKGYVQVALFMEDDDAPPEKAEVIETVEDCLCRGHRHKDIAILTPRNRDVIKIGAWLNERNIPFISYSSLDIRKRKITGELISLLKFLESPADDLSFASFLLGDVFAENVKTVSAAPAGNDLRELIHRHAQREDRRLYVLFRLAFPEVWALCFEHLFTVVGYMPLYDLVCEMLATFHVFATHPQEEATLVTLLEAVREFEQAGTNTLKNFIDYSEQEDDAGAWKIDAPLTADAVQILTVHKAKGLGFPVVIAVLHDQKIKTRNWALMENGTDSPAELFHINSKFAAKSPLLEKLYHEGKFKETVDELNQLYVALTRARHEMYVIGLYKKEPKFPTGYLPVEEFSPGARPPGVSVPVEKREALAALHRHILKPLPMQESERLSSREAKRGDIVHGVLSRIEYVDEYIEQTMQSLVEVVIREFSSDLDRDEVKRNILSFLDTADGRSFFEKRSGRRVLNEQEFASATGALYRADRIVIDDDMITVIDFKTGGDEGEAKYQIQVLGYMGMVAEVFPGKPVQGYLAYIDLRRMRRVL
ncbi:MAG: UvrD-helicase domain-containing protein [Ignavibacteriales bacterium]|nr:UvrD-helicase domain-containing protein [Ignavibacteriales bacterium]